MIGSKYLSQVAAPILEDSKENKSSKDGTTQNPTPSVAPSSHYDYMLHPNEEKDGSGEKEELGCCAACFSNLDEKVLKPWLIYKYDKVSMKK